MSSPRVLLLGGHGKVSLLLNPLLLSRSWSITSVIRDPAQSDTVLSTGKGHPGTVTVLVRSLEDVKSEAQAQEVIDESRPDYVVWSAGAGGKGGPSRTYAIDRDACIHFIRAAANTPSITKFLLISYLGSRRHKAPWWGDEEWKSVQEANAGALKNYYEAKLAADECLTEVSAQRGKGWQGICLRPGTLTDEEGGKVSLGKTKARGKVGRGDVAAVTAAILEREDVKGWIDLLEGEEEIERAVERVGREEVDCRDGE